MKYELEDFLRWFADYEEASMSTRSSAERDRDYYDGIQWTSEEVHELERRGQPPITVNRIAPKVDFILGDERRSRTQPKAWPRNMEQDEKAAHAVTDALRYVLDYSQSQAEYSQAFNELLIEGVGAVELHVKPKGQNDTEICLKQVPWDRLFWDPRSRQADFSDAKYIGTVIWMDYDDALEFFGDSAKEILENALQGISSESNLSATFDDRPKQTLWAENSRSRKRVRVLQVYFRMGATMGSPKWYSATYCKGGFFREVEECWLRDEYGVPLPPLIMGSAKITRENERYGVVRNLIPIQDEINKRRSKALWLLTQRQTIGEQGAVDLATVKHQMARPDGHIVVTPGMRFEVMNNSDFVSGQFELLREAKSEMDMVGAASALSGREPRGQSGVALQTRQYGGMVELEVIKDNFRSLKIRSFRAIWYAIKQYWQAEKWIRITDNEQNLRWVGLNRPVTAAEEFKAQGVNVPDPELLDPETVQQLSQTVRLENDVRYLDVDIIIDETIDTVALQQEEFDQIAKMVQTGLPIPADIIIEMSSIRNKDKILERMRGGNPNPEQQQEQQTQKMQQQRAIELDAAQKIATVRKLDMETQKIEAEGVKTMVEAHLAPDLARQKAQPKGSQG